MRTEAFHYDLPAERIAQTPMDPRDGARLLDGRTMMDGVVRDLPDLLEAGDLVVVNDTRVRAARLRGRRVPTGGSIELLLLERIRADEWTALVKPARRLGVGDDIDLGGLAATVLSRPDRGVVTVALRAVGGGDIEEAIEGVGEMPLPPYIHTPLGDPDRYQTTFAAKVGSAAAPTAGLHLTNDVFAGLAARQIRVATVELAVGLDTFRPITTDTIEAHEMHSERISMSTQAADEINATKQAGGRVVAIGTTVVRTLEACATGARVAPFQGRTDLYITPGYRFRTVDLMMTNFHVPGSSLLVMVAAFIGDEWRELYRTALERGYRFLSFGDAMLLERGDSAEEVE